MVGGDCMGKALRCLRRSLPREEPPAEVAVPALWPEHEVSEAHLRLHGALVALVLHWPAYRVYLL